MKKTYVNVVADSGAATASQESHESRKISLLRVDDAPAGPREKLRMVYQWIHERYMPTIKLRALVRSDKGSVATWVKKRVTVGRISRRPEIAETKRVEGGAR
jgi:hypothetical protein